MLLLLVVVVVVVVVVGVVVDDDDDDDAADDGDDDEDDEDEDEDEEGEDEDENEDDDPLPAGNLLSGGARGGDQGGIEPGPGGGGSNWKVSGFPMVLLPAYSLLKQGIVWVPCDSYF